MENIKDGKSLFDGLASIDTYVRDAFVQGRDSNDGALEILKKILRIHPDDTTPYVCSEKYKNMVYNII